MQMSFNLFKQLDGKKIEWSESRVLLTRLVGPEQNAQTSDVSFNAKGNLWLR